MLEIKGLDAGYGEATVLRGIDLEVGAGQIVALIGANGAGKTTLAKTIAGLLPVHKGEIIFEGTAIEKLKPGQRIDLGVAQVPEGRQIIAGLTVGENLRLGAHVKRRELGESGILKRIDEVCRHFPILTGRLGEPAGNLSGGQQQQLAIARALMVGPKLLVLDEPSLGLSPTLVSDIFKLIANLRAEGISILLSEQNAKMSLAIADHGYVIEMGHVVLQGTGKELINHPEIAERYLGMGKAVEDLDREHREQRHARLVKGLAEILRV